MNPYLEQETVWHDFHQSFIPAARELLSAQVRPAYVVRVEGRLYIHDAGPDERRFVGSSDFAVVSRSARSGTQAASGTLGAPTDVLMPIDVERQSYLEVRTRQGNELVTVIELLSPSNKRRGDDREQYLAKRREVLASGAHLVEIDLLRGGPRMPPEDLPDCDYYVLVSRREHRPKAGVWPLRLRDHLPIVPVPLRAPDADARLDLKQLVDRVYDAAGYEDYIYQATPHPPLHPQDDAGARPFLPK
jgi:hypothetical protein